MEMAQNLEVPGDWEGSYTLTADGYKVNVKRSFSRKVDGDKLKAIADEYGLQQYLPALFRWKPEVSMKAWKEADEAVTNRLALAITATPGRVSFKVEEEDKK